MPIGQVKALDEGFTPTEIHRRNGLMRQFLRVDGPKGSTPEYRRAWARIFGRKTGEHSGDEAANLKAGRCDDLDCWCARD